LNLTATRKPEPSSRALKHRNQSRLISLFLSPTKQQKD
jgi:hypothetical protein